MPKTVRHLVASGPSVYELVVLVLVQSVKRWLATNKDRVVLIMRVVLAFCAFSLVVKPCYLVQLLDLDVPQPLAAFASSLLRDYLRLRNKHIAELMQLLKLLLVSRTPAAVLKEVRDVTPAVLFSCCAAVSGS